MDDLRVRATADNAGTRLAATLLNDTLCTLMNKKIPYGVDIYSLEGI